MYKLHLILKYLRKRRIAWVSLIAVTLCTAMVIVIISVMGGWLAMFKQSFHGLSGDIIVHGRSLTGFPYYEEMAERIEKIPGVKAAVPTIETFGLVNINDSVRQGVRVFGYPIDRIGEVNEFPTSLFLQYQQHIDIANDPNTPKARADEHREIAASHAAHPSFDKPLPAEIYRQLLPKATGDVAAWPGLIVGSALGGVEKNRDGTTYRPALEFAWVKLTVVPVSPEGSGIDLQITPSVRSYWIVDDSHTKVYQYDNNSVYVPFEILQKDLQMDPQPFVNAQTKQPGVDPARASDIQVSALPGQDLDVLREKIDQVVREIATARNIDPIKFPIAVATWIETQQVFIGAVENEKSLVTILFGMISIVAVFLIFCIFYMIVVEKTRDIGIVKSVGATSAGVIGIFLGYGLAIGIVGAFMGLGCGYLVVHNINELHTWLGKTLGIVVWNPEVYAFDTIPNMMNPREVTVIMVIAVVSSVLGALVPAFRAGNLHPVEALRWE